MIVYLKPGSFFPSLHSDTIFGAIIYSLNQLYPDEIESIVSPFLKGEPPFLISSSFPYIEDGKKRLRLYPKIIEKPYFYNFEDLKELKRFKFVEESIFKKWAAGKLNEKNIIESESFYHQDEYILENRPSTTFREKEILIPHNTINRLNSTSKNIFYSKTRTYQNMGRFFLVKFYEKSYKSYLKSALKFLSDRGFGYDISSGYGSFYYEIDKNPLQDYYGGRFVTLSRYIPQDDEIKLLGKDAWFEIGSKRGKSPDGKIRKQVRFFKEGSTFRSHGKEIYGKIVESGDSAIEYGFAYKFVIGGD